MSSNMTDSQQPQTTKSSRSETGQFLSGARHPKWKGSSVPELMGKRFGLLEIIDPQLYRVNGYLHVKCRCHGTGIEKLTDFRNVIQGNTTSFYKNGRRPVLNAEVLGRRYDAIISRCTSWLDPAFRRYGWREIECRFKSRMDFILWVTENLPHPDYKGIEIDRIDNNGHYEPGNLRLATRKEQINNRENTVRISWKGALIPLIDFPSPLSYGPTFRLAKRGYSGEEILNHARESVAKKRKNWRIIKERLESMTY